MKKIYHYTSASSLIGMLTHSQFWATDIAFLNDHKEHVHGYAAALAFIDQKIDSMVDPYKEVLIRFYETLRKFIEPNVLGRDTYVVSFAKDRDSISHWFSYCEKNQGYCICFDEDSFFDPSEKLEFATKYAIKFESVLYESSSFNERLEKILSRDVILEAIKKGIAAEDHGNAKEKDKSKSTILSQVIRDHHEHAPKRQLERIFNEIVFSCGAYKFEGFKHEVERRLVLSSKISRVDERYDYKESDVKFRERNGIIFPYVPVNFNRNSIQEIIIGPSGDFELRRAGLQKLLDKIGIVCKVTSSSTPLRFS
ncbi:DUF2971 domain-containing protein [Pseudomonas sp. efr-133-TYG-5]|uniref:DUF2971 domain-containing protein n=1 Tax=Pseudomonas sp. efr-133-TYG-5 TaxID=3040310 RepID=UPI002554EB30|nr:DUF2971 domain-containing protein [Pseudomonas sp. efr-133-TYG-5]